MKIHFVTLGCPKNLVDSEVMLGFLTEAGFSLIDTPSHADIIVVNTCAFIEDAKKEAIDTILEMGVFKKKDCKLLVVTGCLPQRYENKLEKLLPEVDVFIGVGEFQNIAEIINKSLGDKGSIAEKINVGKQTYLYDHETPRIQATPKHSAYIKIAEGCFHPCSFCSIPKIRGKFRSRPADSIIKEAEEMISRGVKEINLIAQDSTSYGRDIGEDLTGLISRLSRIGGEKWLRILYAYPHELPASLIRAIRNNKDICKYLDIPLQHISNRILKSMRRKETGDEIKRLIERLRYSISGISLRTSLIVGFPGESEKDFEELLDFVCEAKFEHLGVFVYSPEEGTPAAKLKGRIPRKVATERQRVIMETQREISRTNNARLLGKKLKVLVEGVSNESELLLQARHEGQAPEIDGVVYINEGKAATGEFATIQITDYHDYDLVGKITYNG